MSVDPQQALVNVRQISRAIDLMREAHRELLELTQGARATPDAEVFHRVAGKPRGELYQLGVIAPLH